MRDLARLQVDRQLVLAGERRLDPFEVVLGELDRREAGLDRVRVEDVAEARREHDAEAAVLERPRCMLARGAAAEVAAGDEDRGALVLAAGAARTPGSFIQSKNRNSP